MYAKSTELIEWLKYHTHMHGYPTDLIQRTGSNDLVIAIREVRRPKQNVLSQSPRENPWLL